MDTPILDVSAALSEDDYMNLAVVNVSDSQAIETSLPLLEGPVQVFKVGGDENDIRDINSWGSEKVAIKESEWDGSGSFKFQKHSFTLLRWKVNPSRPNLDGVVKVTKALSAGVLNSLHSNSA